MIFSEPNAWWGLLGIVVPVMIHYLSKKDKIIVNFGSLKFLKPIESESAQSIQLSQYMLLLLRILLLAFISYMMARPLTNKKEKRKIYWIEQQLLNDDDYNTYLDNILTNEEVRMFTFEKNDNSSAAYFSSAWGLIDALNESTDSAEVYSHSLFKNFIGQPLSLLKQIKWNILPIKEVKLSVRKIYKEKTLTEWSVGSNDHQLIYYSSELQVNEELENSPPMRIHLKSNGENASALLIKSIVESIVPFLPYPVKWVENASDLRKTDWLISIGEDADTSMNWINWQQNDSPLEILRIGTNKYQMSGKLNMEEILLTNLPVILSSIFNNYYINSAEYDNRIYNPGDLPADYFERLPNAGKATNQENYEYSSIWWLLVIPIIVGERLYSSLLNRVK